MGMGPYKRGGARGQKQNIQTQTNHLHLFTCIVSCECYKHGQSRVGGEAALFLNCPAELFPAELPHAAEGVGRRSDRAGYKEMHLSSCLWGDRAGVSSNPGVGGSIPGPSTCFGQHRKPQLVQADQH